MGAVSVSVVLSELTLDDAELGRPVDEVFRSMS